MRNVLFIMIFIAALILFLGSLSGIGPIDEDYQHGALKSHDHDPDIDSGMHQPGPDPSKDDKDAQGEGIQPDGLGSGGLPMGKNSLPVDIPDPDAPRDEGDTLDDEEDHEQHHEEDFFQHHADDFLENRFESGPAKSAPQDIQSPHKPLAENTHDIDHGHPDELLSNNDDQKIDQAAGEDHSPQASPPTKLIKGADEEILDDSFRDSNANENNLDLNNNRDDLDDALDLSDDNYLPQDPHSTFMKILKSLEDKDLFAYTKNRDLSMATDESLDPSCGKWQNTYTNLHSQILKGDQPQKYISYICDVSENCGGWADRMLGMTSTFIFALLTDRAFLAEWQTPLPLETIFDSPNINWSYNSRHPDLSVRDLEVGELNAVDFNGQHLDNQFLHSNWTLKFPEPFIKFRTNRGMVIRTFNSEVYSSKLKDLGLRPYTAIGCIMDYLFRPTQPALFFINQYTALFSLPNIFSVGIQIRTKTKLGSSLEDQQNGSMQHYKKYFQCADQLAQTYAAVNQKVVYFLITDSEKLRAEVVENTDNVVISGLHIDQGYRRKGRAETVHNAIIENWILSRVNYRIISPGGYGKLAAFHSKKLHTTIEISPPEFEDPQDAQAPDCTQEDAFTSFKELASRWSLG